MLVVAYGGVRREWGAGSGGGGKAGGGSGRREREAGVFHSETLSTTLCRKF